MPVQVNIVPYRIIRLINLCVYSTSKYCTVSDKNNKTWDLVVFSAYKRLIIILFSIVSVAEISILFIRETTIESNQFLDRKRI